MWLQKRRKKMFGQQNERKKMFDTPPPKQKQGENP